MLQTCCSPQCYQITLVYMHVSLHVHEVPLRFAHGVCNNISSACSKDAASLVVKAHEDC